MFVKFVYDDTVLNSRLEESDEKLKDHDELIKELQKKIESLATNSQLEIMHDTLIKEVENKISEMNNKYQDLLNKYNSTVEQVQNLSDTVDTKFNALTEYVDSKLQQSYDNIMTVISRDHSRLENCEELIHDCEDKLNSQKKKLSDCHLNVQQIASSIASFNNTDVILDKNLQGNLKESINFVKNNFQKVFQEIGRLKNSSSLSNTAKPGITDTLNSILQQQNTSNRFQSSSQKPSILSPHVSKPGLNLNSQTINQKQQIQNKELISGNNQINNDSDNQIQSKNDTQEKIEPEPKKELTPRKDESAEEINSLKPSKSETEIKTKSENENELKTTVNSSSIVNNNSTQNVTFSTPKKAVGTNTIQESQQPSQPPKTLQSSSKSRDFIPYDLTKVRPYSDIQVHWQDHPRLPDVRPFMKIEEVVDHLYKLQPYIQAYLYAMHDKLVESSSQIQQKADKNLVEKMFERMQGIVSDIKYALNRLKDEVQQTATRAEINGFIDELMKSTRTDAQTAVGRVRCIACGRETTQITGAMTEAEIERTLGNNTPISLMRGVVNHKPGMAYSSIEGFDSAIVEEPRSKRPPQAVLSQSHSQQPSNKIKAKLQ